MMHDPPGPFEVPSWIAWPLGVVASIYLVGWWLVDRLTDQRK